LKRGGSGLLHFVSELEESCEPIPNDGEGPGEAPVLVPTVALDTVDEGPAVWLVQRRAPSGNAVARHSAYAGDPPSPTAALRTERSGSPRHSACVEDADLEEQDEDGSEGESGSERATSPPPTLAQMQGWGQPTELFYNLGRLTGTGRAQSGSPARQESPLTRPESGFSGGFDSPSRCVPVQSHRSLLPLEMPEEGEASPDGVGPSGDPMPAFTIQTLRRGTLKIESPAFDQRAMPTPTLSRKESHPGPQGGHQAPPGGSPIRNFSSLQPHAADGEVEFRPPSAEIQVKNSRSDWKTVQAIRTSHGRALHNLIAEGKVMQAVPELDFSSRPALHGHGHRATSPERRRGHAPHTPVLPSSPLRGRPTPTPGDSSPRRTVVVDAGDGEEPARTRLLVSLPPWGGQAAAPWGHGPAEAGPSSNNPASNKLMSAISSGPSPGAPFASPALGFEAPAPAMPRLGCPFSAAMLSSMGKSSRSMMSGVQDDDRDDMSDIGGRGAVGRGGRNRRSSAVSISGMSSASGGSRRSKAKKNDAPEFSNWEIDTYLPIIEQSWAKLNEDYSSEDISMTFFEIFFEKCPAIVHVFDMNNKEKHSRHLGLALNFIVENSQDPSSLMEQMRGIAKLHIESGLRLEFIECFGEALLQMLTTLRESHPPTHTHSRALLRRVHLALWGGRSADADHAVLTGVCMCVRACVGSPTELHGAGARGMALALELRGGHLHVGYQGGDGGEHARVPELGDGQLQLHGRGNREALL